ncbi:MAG: hypothetical protein KAT77_03770 [Nanoarchaeota archaeon]|nr:hypothetical protein [Nanoarchaeota archaeon]
MNKKTKVNRIIIEPIYLTDPTNALVFHQTHFDNNHIDNIGDLLKHREKYLDLLNDYVRHQRQLDQVRGKRLELIASFDNPKELLDFTEEDDFGFFEGRLLKKNLLYSFMFDKEASKIDDKIFEERHQELYDKTKALVEAYALDDYFEPLKENLMVCTKDKKIGNPKSRTKAVYNTFKRITSILGGGRAKFANTNLSDQCCQALISYFREDGPLPVLRPEERATLFSDRYAFTLMAPSSIEETTRDFRRNHQNIEITNDTDEKTDDSHHHRQNFSVRDIRPEFFRISMEVLIKTEADFIEGKLFYGEYKGVGLSSQEKDLREGLVKKLRKGSMRDAQEILFERTKKILS